MSIRVGSTATGTSISCSLLTYSLTLFRGCVTPKQLENMKAECAMDMDYVDGYDELPHDFQEKVYRALDQGHVDMEDWKGDPEYNVPGKTGTGPRKTKKQKEAEVIFTTISSFRALH